MNAKKIMTMVLVLLFLALVGNTTAQQTYYVNNQTGNDANSGTTPGDAKATVFSAMIAAPAGSFISVAGTGINYNEAAPTARETFTFVSTGSTPVFDNAFNVGVLGWVGGGIAGITAGPNSVVTTALANGISNGDMIYIDGTGDANYDKKYFTASAVNPALKSFTINNTAGGVVGAVGNVAARGDVTFQGPFTFNGGLNLNVGTLTNGNQVTVKGTVYRTELGSVAASGLVFSGNVNVTYDNQYTATAVTTTTGFEWPSGTTANNLTTMNSSGGGITLKLDNNRSMGGVSSPAGVLTTVGPFNLNTYQLTINGASAGHTVGGDVTNGTIDFALTGAATIGGAFNLPNIIADVTSGAAALTISATVTQTGNLTANSSATLTANVNGNSGNILSNGGGAISWVGQTATSTVGTVTTAAASTANVTLNNSAANPITTGAITHSGTGTISFGGNVNAVNVGTSGTSTNVVLNSVIPAFANGAANVVTGKAIVAFPDVPVTIWGAVTNSATFSGSSDQTGNNGNGLITFASTVSPNHVTVKNTITNNVSGSYAFTGTPVGGGTNNGRITFANTTANLVLAGVTNSSTFSYSSTPVTAAADIMATAGGAGTVTFAAMVNNSTYAGANIDFSLMTGVISGVSISQTGTVKGGQIMLGNGAASFSSDITNSRGVAGSDITIGTAASGVNFTGKNLVNHGASNIVINSVSGAGTVGLSGITCDGTGTISFPNTTVGGGGFSLGTFTVNLGTVSFGNGDGGIGITGVVMLTNGTVNFGTAGRAVTLSGAQIQLGGLGTKVTFTSSPSNLIFAQPVPNVSQVITLGTLDQTWPGWVDVANVALLPAPYVFFQSIAGSTGLPGNLYILNSGGNPDGLRFDTGNPTVLQSVQLDNARLYVGKNAPAAANGGGFQNTTGYATVHGGFIMMSGGTGPAQAVNGAAIDAGATFGNFGVDNNSGTSPCVTFNSGGQTATMVGDFYLAQGAVLPTNLDFTAGSPYSTIFRTEGTFTVVLPDPTSKVNVTYYGSDKTTSNEIPVGTSKLWNMTVATTNGAKPGFGIIKMNGPLTVNGTLTVNANQALYTDVYPLTMAGASAVINGYLVDNGSPQFILGAPTGTTISGSGVLPTIQVANSSLNNSVTGNTGLYSLGFGADGAWGGGDDDFTNADGNILYIAGTGDTGSSLTVGFTGNGPHFGNLTIGAAPLPTAGTETFMLSSNAVMSGNIVQGGQVIDLGGFTLTHQGIGFQTDGTPANGSQIKNGTLNFSPNPTVLNVVGAAATIAANVNFNAPGATITLPALGSPPYSLTITGDVMLFNNGANTAGTTVDIAPGNILTLGGANVTVSSLSVFTASGAGTGVLDLTNSAPNTLLTFTIPANAAVANLTIDGNVTLAGGIAASTLTVTNFVHNSGLFTFGTASLQIGNTTAATFTRNGGTYAGDGWLIWNSTTAAGFKHSAVAAAGAMTINSFQLMQPLTLQNAVNFNVVKNFYLNGASLTNQVGGTGPGYVFLGDADNVPMVRVLVPNDVLANALQFSNANADYTFNGPTGATVSTRVWPSSATLARHVFVNMAAAGNTLTLAADRAITGNLTLTSGVLTWDSPTVITIGSGSTITRNANGALNKDANGDLTTGTLTAPNVNLVYTGNVGNSGIEYSDPVVVTNLSLPTTNAADMVTLNAARTVAGTVTIGNAGSVLTVAANTTFSAAQNITTGLITVNPGMTLTLGAASTLNNVTGNVTANAALTLNGNHAAGNITASGDVTVAATGSFAATSNLAFVGTAGATLTIPAAGTTAGNLTLNKTGSAPVPRVTLASSNANVATTLTVAGVVNFVNGLFVTGDNILTLPTVTQGFTRPAAGVVPPNASHVVGNVRKNPAAFFVGRLEYPVGTSGNDTDPMPRYRPAAITFLPGNPLITAAGIMFKHVDSDPNPGGVNVGFPIDAGGFVSLTGHAPFYWLATSTVGLGPSQTFDLELWGEGFTTYENGSFGINQLRIIRRFDGSEEDNMWVLQGGNNYTNYITNEPVPGTPVVRVIGSSGGIEVARSRFTIGTGLITDVAQQKRGIPTEYNLSQNYPNPFNPSTQINFDLPKQSPVTLEIYDMLGQKVRTLISGDMMDPGYYHVTWNGTNQYGHSVSSGVYYYRIVADKFTSLKKMMFLK